MSSHIPYHSSISQKYQKYFFDKRKECALVKKMIASTEKKRCTFKKAKINSGRMNGCASEPTAFIADAFIKNWRKWATICAFFVAKYKNYEEFGLYICISQFFFVSLHAFLKIGIY